MTTTKPPRSRLILNSAFLYNKGGRSTLFPVKEESTILATLSPFPTKSTGTKPFPVDPLLPPTRAAFLKPSTGSASPFYSSQTPLYVRNASSASEFSV